MESKILQESYKRINELMSSDIASFYLKGPDEKTNLIHLNIIFYI